MKLKNPFRHSHLSLKSIKKDINHGLKNIHDGSKYALHQFDKVEKGVRQGVEQLDKGIEYVRGTGVVSDIPFGDTVFGAADIALDTARKGLRGYEHLRRS